MTFEMIRYMEYDGIRTVPDSEIMRLFERTAKEGLDKVVFYDQLIQTPVQFLQMARSWPCTFWILKDDGKTIGYTWLNRHEGHGARCHFCVFVDYWGKSIDIGKFVLHELMHMKDPDGEYVYDLLTGYVPAWNERAINFSLKCGGQSLGTIPNAIWNEDKKQSESAVFIHYTRGMS